MSAALNHSQIVSYADFLRRHDKTTVLFLELGVGYNTPVIIKYPFWQMTAKSPKATYACLNYGDAAYPAEIEAQSIYMSCDAGEVIAALGRAE